MNVRIKIYGFTVMAVVVSSIFYWQWTPGQLHLNNHNNFQENGLWMGHGWIGDDSWFKKYGKNINDFDANRLASLSKRASDLRIGYIFPHLCPTNSMGIVPGINQQRLTRLKVDFKKVKILPWIGGSTESTVDLTSKQWTDGFVESIRNLLLNEDIDGVHVNIEPLTSGDEQFLVLLRRIHEIKGRKILSVAAYPPPTWFHPHPSVHWDLEYYRKVSLEADQLVPMMYDTALKYKKPYTHLLISWTKEIINNSNDKNILFGIPAYDDKGVGYHDPDIENVSTSIPGIIAGINSANSKRNFGLSIYSEWELDDEKIKNISEFIPK